MVPDEFVAEGLLRALAGEEMGGQWVLLPRAEGGRRELVDGLNAMGARVDELPLYAATVPREPDAEGLRRLRAGDVDVVALASSSSARNLILMLGGDVEPLSQALIACIGPVTARTVEEMGLVAPLVAEEHTIIGLVQALEEHFSPVSSERGRM